MELLCEARGWITPLLLLSEILQPTALQTKNLQWIQVLTSEVHRLRTMAFDRGLDWAEQMGGSEGALRRVVRTNGALASWRTATMYFMITSNSLSQCHFCQVLNLYTLKALGPQPMSLDVTTLRYKEYSPRQDS